MYKHCEANLDQTSLFTQFTSVSVFQLTKCFSIKTSQWSLAHCVFWEMNGCRGLTPGHTTIKASLLLTNSSHINTTILRYFMMVVVWRRRPVETLMLGSGRSLTPALFCFSAPLAQEERSGCCLINGGKKLNDSQHERESESSRMFHRRSSYKLS